MIAKIGEAPLKGRFWSQKLFGGSFCSIFRWKVVFGKEIWGLGSDRFVLCWNWWTICAEESVSKRSGSFYPDLTLLRSSNLEIWLGDSWSGPNRSPAPVIASQWHKLCSNRAKHGTKQPLARMECRIILPKSHKPIRDRVIFGSPHWFLFETSFSNTFAGVVLCGLWGQGCESIAVWDWLWVFRIYFCSFCKGFVQNTLKIWSISSKSQCV